MMASDVLSALRLQRTVNGTLERDSVEQWAQLFGLRFGSGYTTAAVFTADDKVVKFCHYAGIGHSGSMATDYAFFSSVRPDDAKYFPASELTPDNFLIQETVSLRQVYTLDVLFHLVRVAFRYGISDLHNANWGMRDNETPVIFDVGYHKNFRQIFSDLIDRNWTRADAFKETVEYTHIDFHLFPIVPDEMWDRLMDECLS